jgi:hypothetical protein
MATIVTDLRRTAGQTLVIAVLALALLPATAPPSLSQARASNYLPVDTPLVAVDWQDPLSLPPRFRNHCSYDVNRGQPYCSNHCGIGYQFFYCSPASFGCCHPGYGYCDWKGHLRCAP